MTLELVLLALLGAVLGRRMLVRGSRLRPETERAVEGACVLLFPWLLVAALLTMMQFYRAEGFVFFFAVWAACMSLALACEYGRVGSLDTVRPKLYLLTAGTVAGGLLWLLFSHATARTFY